MSIRIVLSTTLLFALTSGALAQAPPSAADGPWSGQVECVLSGHGTDYQDDQTHTWRITGGPPRPVGVFREWPAVWSVEGRGSIASFGGAPMTWTTRVAETSAPITFAEDSGRIRITSRHGLIVNNGAMIVVNSNTRAPSRASLQEWDFPRIEDDASATRISGTRSRSTPYSRGWRQPTDIMTMETCTWKFTRVPPPPPLSTSGGPTTPPPSVAFPGDPAVTPTPAPIATADASPQTPPPAPAAPTGRRGQPPDLVSRAGFPTIAPTDASGLPGRERPTGGVPDATNVCPALIASAHESFSKLRASVQQRFQPVLQQLAASRDPESVKQLESLTKRRDELLATLTAQEEKAVQEITKTETRGCAGMDAVVVALIASMQEHIDTTLAGLLPTPLTSSRPPAPPTGVAGPPEQTAEARPSQVTTTSPPPPVATTVILNPGLLPPVTTKPSVADVLAHETATPPSDQPPPASEATASLDAAATPTTCTVAGPHIDVEATPGSVHLTWARDPINLNTSSAYGTFPNAEYKVLRNDSGGRSVRNASATDPPLYDILHRILPVGVTHVTLLDIHKTYTYSVYTRKYTRVVTQQSATTTENGCWVSRVTVTPPRPQTPILANYRFDQRLRTASISVKMVPQQGQTGFLVLGPGLPAEGKEIKIYPPETVAVAVIRDVPAGSQTWIVAPYWTTPEGRAIDILGSGLRLTETIPPPPGPPGPPPTGINVKAFPNSNPLTDTCSVSLVATWAPVPGATGYTVYNSGFPVSDRIPLTTFTFPYPVAMRNADLVKGAIDANYRNRPEFTGGVQVKVAASFPDKSDGMSAAVPFTFSTYPCLDPRNSRD